MSQLFSQSVEDCLHLLKPRRMPSNTSYCFPASIQDAEIRRGTDEPLHEWFTRIHDHCESRPRGFDKLEPNLAVFVVLKWNTVDQLTQLSYANIQSIRTESSLEDYYLSPTSSAEYLRLDLDTESLGEMFTHTQPHLHRELDKHLRFSFDVGPTGNVVLDFLEFLYRMYHHDKWLKWTELVWNKSFDGPPANNPWRKLVEAFKSGELITLQKHHADLKALKNALQSAKDKAFPHFMNTTDRELLAYPILHSV